MKSYTDPRALGSLSLLTRSKISAALTGRKDTDETRAKKCFSPPWYAEQGMGSLNPFFGKGPDFKAIEAVAELSGTKIYVYDVNSFTLAPR